MGEQHWNCRRPSPALAWASVSFGSKRRLSDDDNVYWWRGFDAATGDGAEEDSSFLALPLLPPTG